MRLLSPDTKFYVYAHRRVRDNSVFYVGKGCANRSHSRNFRNTYWQRIVKKDGGFAVEKLLENIDEELAFFVEEEAIAALRARGCALVNVTLGGEGATGLRHTDEYKAAASARMQGNKIGLGRKHTAEAKLKISEHSRGNKYSLGRKMTDEERAKCQPYWDAQKGRPLKASALAALSNRKWSQAQTDKHIARMKAFTHTDAAKEKMRTRAWTDEQREAARARMLGRILSEETKQKMSATGKRLFVENEKHPLRRKK